MGIIDDRAFCQLLKNYPDFKKSLNLNEIKPNPLLHVNSSISDSLLWKNEECFLICKNGLTKIYPHYKEEDFIIIGNEKHKVIVKEITNKEELESQKYLSEFHYRKNQTFGRGCKLIVVSKEKSLPDVLGYIELCIAPLLNKARNNVLNAPYNDGHIKWDKWNFDTIGKYSKAIVSISRVVTHPEVRGLNISSILIKNAIKYAKTRWQIKGIKPIFIEITADMLKFIPFVQKPGMLYIGNTEGNISRIKNDLKYYFRNKKRFLKTRETSSLIRMQSHYVRKVEEILKESKITERELIKIVNNIDENKIKKNYSIFNGIIRFPKPTFLLGLTNESQSFLEKRINELNIRYQYKNIDVRIKPLNSPIKFEDVSLEFTSNVDKTDRTNTIQEAFGIYPENLKSRIFSDLNFIVSSGEIILIGGSSGSGKTSLLKLLIRKLKPTSGRVILPDNLKVGMLHRLSSKKPLIELVGKNVEEALYYLNKAGLSEANLYLRHFNELSDGQKYRAMIAKLLSSGCNLWIGDEFLNSLDYITASIVANNIRNFAKKYGITVIVATSNYKNIISTLKPDKIFLKSIGSKYEILSC